jgi:aryl-alcohol dehydrogenase-like predicted oxidoreductase
MEYRQLGGSGFAIPSLTFGTATFGGSTDGFKIWGSTDVREATRLIDIAMDAGVTMFDTADMYSYGMAEEILGKAIKGRGDRVLIATKGGQAMSEGPNNEGLSRERIIRACEDSLRRLGVDCIDLYHLHSFDALTPVEDMLYALELLIRAGKIRYFGVSNFSGWHLMKMVATAERNGLPRPVAHQAYYSLAGREYEWELMPVALDQKVSTIVWSPLAGSRLAGKVGRNKPAPEGSRAATGANGPDIPPDKLFSITDALEAIAEESGRPIAQVALAWVLSRPTVASVVIGARNEEQLKSNLGVIGWSLSADQIARLDAASDQQPIYPYWHQQLLAGSRNPLPAAG